MRHQARERWWRRNFKRMYPEEVKRMERRQQLQLRLRVWTRGAVIAAAIAAAAAVWCRLVLR